MNALNERLHHRQIKMIHTQKKVILGLVSGRKWNSTDVIYGV